MTAGIRPSRRTPRAAPLPIPSRAVAVRVLVSAIAVSYSNNLAIGSRPSPPGVSETGRAALIDVFAPIGTAMRQKIAHSGLISLLRRLADWDSEGWTSAKG